MFRISMIAIVGALGLSAAPAQAGSDWTGFYAGAVASAGSGDQTYSNSATYDLTGDAFGLFAGYNYQNGNLVFGGELSVQRGSIYEDGFPSFEFDRLVDLKLRLGYAAQNVLFYGALGFADANWIQGPGDEHSADGALFGAGVEFKFADRYFVGLEYLTRDVEAPNAGVGFEANLNTLSLRVGMGF